MVKLELAVTCPYCGASRDIEDEGTSLFLSNKGDVQIELKAWLYCGNDNHSYWVDELIDVEVT